MADGSEQSNQSEVGSTAAQEEPPPWNEATEQEVLTTLLIPMALARLDISLDSADGTDEKAIGTLALATAVVALLIATHTSINRLWWIPALGAVAAGVLFLIAVWPRRFNAGPNVNVFRERYAGLDRPLEASRQMLVELDTAFRHNLHGGYKIKLYRWGLGILALSLIACLPVALIRP